MADKVSVLDVDGGLTYYSTYAAARAAIISVPIEHPLIQIWATLTNEQIILLNGVDIWIAPGVTIDYLPPSLTTAAPTITDNGVECHCKIYGTGVIKNTFLGTTGNVYECIKTTNANTELEIECDYIEGVGKIIEGFAGVSVRIDNGKKFHLKCNKVYNQNNVAMYIGSSNPINDLNFIIEKVETGIPNTTTTGATAIITRGNGFIDINEILCRNLGHCLSHRAGSMTAMIRKMTTVNNIIDLHAATVHVPGSPQGTATQKLILYFDVINSIHGTQNCDEGIQLSGGTGIFIGRKVYSEISEAQEDGATVSIKGTNTKGFVKCNEIICTGRCGIVLNSFTSQITIDLNYIEGFKDVGVVFTAGAANFIMKNAKIKNTYTGSTATSLGIFIFEGNQNIDLNNVKVISGNFTNGKTIYFVGGSGTFYIKNYGLFVNKDIESNVDLKIGTGLNYQYIISTDLS